MNKITTEKTIKVNGFQVFNQVTDIQTSEDCLNYCVDYINQFVADHPDEFEVIATDPFSKGHNSIFVARKEPPCSE